MIGNNKTKIINSMLKKNSNNAKLKLITRSNLDGLVCAALLREINLIDDVKFVHPKDVQDNKINIGKKYVTAGLPYSSNVYLAFDHHLSEKIRNDNVRNLILNPAVYSTAKVIYDYFRLSYSFSPNWQSIISAVDRSDFDLTKEEVLNPDRWVLMRFLTDSRTGLGRYKSFTISNYQLMLKLVDCFNVYNIDEILSFPDIKERTDLLRRHQLLAISQIKRCAKLYDRLVILDLRRETEIFTANRFLIYALFPACNIAFHVVYGLNKKNTVISMGKSNLNRSSNTVISELCLKFGGGGHYRDGSIQVPNEDVDFVLKGLIKTVNDDG